MLMSQSKNVFTVGFDLTNGDGAQPDLKYSVILMTDSSSSPSVVDQKVYDDVVSLSVNDSKHITATYTAPDFLSGKYLLVVQVKNSAGFPIGTAQLQTVTLQGTGRYLSIDTDSCYLTVAQDATSTKYTIGQGVDVRTSEDLIAHCMIDNLSSAAMTTVPHFTTYRRSIYGSVVYSTTQGSISFPAKSSEKETFTIPQASDPQAYDAVLMLTDASGNQISNTIDFHYVIHGESATIQSILFDKDLYATGDTANISLVWSGSADTFIGSRLGPTSEGALTAKVQIKNGSGAACSEMQTISLAGQSEKATLQVPVTASCKNPSAEVSLVDASGKVLASGSYGVQTKTGSSNAIWWWIVGVLLAITIVCGIYLFVKRKKKGPTIPTTVPDTMKVVALFALAVGSMFMLFSTRVNAKTAMANGYQYIMDGDGGGGDIGGGGIQRPIISSTSFLECVNNACSKVYGQGQNSCTSLGDSCGAPVDTGNNQNASSGSGTPGSGNTSGSDTYLACSSNSCVLVQGRNQQNLDGCTSQGQSCSAGDETCTYDDEGNETCEDEGITAIGFDVNLDRDQYSPGEQVIGTGEFDYTQCANGSNSVRTMLSLILP
jgi:hypothetical protein